MADLKIRPSSQCPFDMVALDEVMLHLNPGEGHIRTARSVRAGEGGGEHNVARGLRRALCLRAAIATALANIEIGRPECLQHRAHCPGVFDGHRYDEIRAHRFAHQSSGTTNQVQLTNKGAHS